MGIENWMDRDAEAPANLVDEPRRHTLGGFRPGKGFAPSEVDENDETLTAPIDVELDKDSVFENDDTIDAPFA